MTVPNFLPLRIVLVLAATLMSGLLAACTSTPSAKKGSTLAAAIPAGMARINIHRNWNMVGAIVTHKIVDKGEGIINDVTLVQRESNLDDRGNRNRSHNVLSEISGVASNLEARNSEGRYLIPAKLVGSFGAGGTLIYERPAGLMKLETYSPNGDQAFAPWTEVKAGKEYNVEYFYLKATFVVEEK